MPLDDIANINMMKGINTDFEKVYYIGYSQGTIQMLFALADYD